MTLEMFTGCRAPAGLHKDQNLVLAVRLVVGLAVNASASVFEIKLSTYFGYFDPYKIFLGNENK